MSTEIERAVLAGDIGWYVPGDATWCPRCGDQNWTDQRLCITCTEGDDGYADGRFRDGWRSSAVGGSAPTEGS